MRGKIIKLYEEDEDILEDAITENRQAIEMAKKMITDETKNAIIQVYDDLDEFLNVSIESLVRENKN